ncbi:MAG: 4,4'-diaponeurosporenoate glycosyltransferase [candidate division WS2 bacterium]|uniref:4,4'-diaponeurosporenoate glycosyltransferase n=1 Tax=Psychracetigena formicireducens TaxID=2986056 RepID=A0A9E2F5E8_PSYF1|nr:4,4'-diaponeurosporenoate glycosyltransferase [Candidatus Psychracetigena formicireducens]MBT9144300.1 4,4'-diaponeurosporenoate glycosyltransferase [Candidatus Psychracetigena formicireducens]
MVEQFFEKKASVIIPAYNEEPRIGQVIQAVIQSELVGEIIVINDGSTDMTSESAINNTDYLVEFKKNSGKSNALITGAKLSSYEVLLFIDADITNLKPHHLDSLLTPVFTGEVDTSIGVFKGGRLITDFTQALTPALNSQRAIKRETFFLMKDSLQGKGYAIEPLIYKNIRKMGLKEKKVYLYGVSQVMKTEKLGFWRGFLSHLKMYWEILQAIAGK